MNERQVASLDRAIVHAEAAIASAEAVLRAERAAVAEIEVFIADERVCVRTLRRIRATGHLTSYDRILLSDGER